MALALLALLVAAPAAYCLRRQHFYLGLPATYWGSQVARWARDEKHWTEPWPEKMLTHIHFRRMSVSLPASQRIQRRFPF
jgi:hypothetical protein